jgi:hypothetical protein
VNRHAVDELEEHISADHGARDELGDDLVGGRA